MKAYAFVKQICTLLINSICFVLHTIDLNTIRRFCNWIAKGITLTGTVLRSATAVKINFDFDSCRFVLTFNLVPYISHTVIASKALTVQTKTAWPFFFVKNYPLTCYLDLSRRLCYCVYDSDTPLQMCLLCGSLDIVLLCIWAQSKWSHTHNAEENSHHVFKPWVTPYRAIHVNGSWIVIGDRLAKKTFMFLRGIL